MEQRKKRRKGKKKFSPCIQVYIKLKILFLAIQGWHIKRKMNKYYTVQYFEKVVYHAIINKNIACVNLFNVFFSGMINENCNILKLGHIT